MPTNTLTSLAILRVQVDQNKDYLTYLEPFVLQILADSRVSVASTNAVAESLVQDFGLAIPERTVDVVLRRFTRRKILTRVNNELRITGTIPDPQLTEKYAEAQRHIHSVINGVKRFSLPSANPMEDDDQVIEAICAFLSEFDVSCLRSYLKGTAIPEIDAASSTEKVLVSDYVQSIHLNQPERFNSFLILVQGHMLANALVCPDLEHVRNSFSGVTFYLDTPLLIRSLGLEGGDKRKATVELIDLLKNLQGKVAAFTHSVEELHNVIQGAADNLESPGGRGAIIQEARQAGTTKSDLVILAETIDDELAQAGIEVELTPRYVESVQIDEHIFEQVLGDEVSYFNLRAKEYDVNSVRSIYVKRNKKRIQSLEKSHAILVTSNSAFAKAAWQYGQQYEPSQAASTVITDFTLANIAWLKSPMGGASIPTTQLMAFSYAALQPSGDLLNKYMNEIDRLEANGTISERAHQLLRSSPMVSKELMNLTLGDDQYVTSETVTQILERLTSEIEGEAIGRAESSERGRANAIRALNVEEERSQQLERVWNSAQNALADQIEQNNALRSKLYWECHRRAKFWARGMSVVLAVLLIAVIVVSSLEFVGLPPSIRWTIVGALAMLTAANLLYGLTVKGTYNWLEAHLRTKFVRRRANDLGIELEGLSAI